MGIPLPALAIRSPRFEGPLDLSRKAVQLKTLLQGQQLNQQTLQGNELKLQQRQQAQQEQQRAQSLYREVGADWEEFFKKAPRRGIGMETLLKLKESYRKDQQEYRAQSAEERLARKEKMALFGNEAAAVGALDESERKPAFLQRLQFLVEQGRLEPEQAKQFAQLAQLPDEEFNQQLELIHLSAIGATKLFDAVEKREARTTRQKEFQSFYPVFREANNLPKSAKVEIWAHHAFEKMRQGGKEPGSYIPLVNERGVVIGAWNPKAGKTVGAPGIEGARKAPLSASAIKEETILAVMLEDIGRLEELSAKHPEAIGPIQGRLGAIRAKTVGNLPEITELRRLAFNLSDQLLRARSGAQINEQEYARLSRLVPQPSDPDIDFSTKLKSFREEIQRTLAIRRGDVAPSREAVSDEGPKVRDRREHMGVWYEFDGSRWVKE